MLDLCMLPDTRMILLATSRDHFAGICHIRLGCSRPRKCRWCRGHIYNLLLWSRLDNSIAYLQKLNVREQEAEREGTLVIVKASSSSEL
jgi:hypothetical protein